MTSPFYKWQRRIQIICWLLLKIYWTNSVTIFLAKYVASICTNFRQFNLTRLKLVIIIELSNVSWVVLYLSNLQGFVQSNFRFHRVRNPVYERLRLIRFVSRDSRTYELGYFASAVFNYFGHLWTKKSIVFTPYNPKIRRTYTASMAKEKWTIRTDLQKVSTLCGQNWTISQERISKRFSRPDVYTQYNTSFIRSEKRDINEALIFLVL